jgi:hypothetical protein
MAKGVDTHKARDHLQAPTRYAHIEGSSFDAHLEA